MFQGQQQPAGLGFPDPGRLGGGAGEHPRAVRAERYRVNLPDIVAVQGPEQFTALRVPDPRHRVGGAGDDPRAVRAEGDGVNPAVAGALHLHELFPAFYIPDLGLAVLKPDDDPFAFRAVRHGPDPVREIHQVELPAGQRIPDPGGPVVGTGDDPFAVRAGCDRIDHAAVPLQGRARLFVTGSPDPGRPILKHGDNPAATRACCHRLDDGVELFKDNFLRILFLVPVWCRRGFSLKRINSRGDRLKVFAEVLQQFSAARFPDADGLVLRGGDDFFIVPTEDRRLEEIDVPLEKHQLLSVPGVPNPRRPVDGTRDQSPSVRVVRHRPHLIVVPLQHQ